MMDFPTVQEFDTNQSTKSGWRMGQNMGQKLTKLRACGLPPWFGGILSGSVLLGSVLLSGCEPIPTPSQVNAANPGGGNRLDTVLRRGKLICGVSGELPGFSFVNKEGKYSGIDVDVCRAVAAALFDNPDAVQYRNLNAKERFTALQAGEVDLL
ncbi:MAG: transporter substrate-binding domain-containing protein, partial [Pseudanabaenaceae cyanobacterium]